MTDYVIMPKADYQSVCDLIRSKSGKTAPILSGQLKSEIEALLEKLPEPPTEPPIEIKKLSAPVIRLETVTDGGGENPGVGNKKLSAPIIRLEEGGGEYDDSEYTPAILGVARLGQTKLGDSGSGLPKLTAPVIRMETVTDGSEEPEEPDEPEKPEILKLDAPAITLETAAEPEEPEEPVEPEEPAVLKLNTPKIELVGE